MNTSVLLLILGLVARGFSLSCPPPPIRCDPPPFGCRYGFSKGLCGCLECDVGPGDECGGPFQSANCADGLECQEPSPFDHNGNPFPPNQPGVCVHRAPPGGNTEFSIGHQRFAVLADKKGLNWWQAQTACQNRGYELAQPDDLISLSQYVATNYGLTDYWLGGYSTPTNIPVWLNGNIIPYDRDLWRTEYNAARGHCTYLKDATIPTRFGNSPGILGNWECSQRQYMTPLCELPGSGFPHGLVLYSLAPAPAAAAPAPAASFAPVPVAAAPVPAAAFAPPVPPPVALEGAGSIPE